jgi:hypothetical protein
MKNLTFLKTITLFIFFTTASSIVFSQSNTPPTATITVDVEGITLFTAGGNQPSRVITFGQVLRIVGNGLYRGSVTVNSGGHIIACGNITLYGSMVVQPGGTYWETPTTRIIGSLVVYGTTNNSAGNCTVAPVCDNFTNAGSINGAQTSCGSYNPTNMGNAGNPSGGSGDTQYQWQYKTTGDWDDIDSANSATYNPSTISITTQYQRGARRSGCSNYVFTTSITKVVDNQITASNTTSTASITELQTKSLEGSPSGGTWSIVSGGGSITDATYTPADITADTSITIKYTIAADGSCDAVTSDRIFTVTPVVISWDGSEDNDWSNVNNWSTNTLPANNNAVVVIPSGLDTYPTATGPVSVNSVIMNSGSSLIAEDTFIGALTYNRTLIDDWHLIASPVVGETIENMYLKNNFIQAGNGDIGLAPYQHDSNTWGFYKDTSTGAITSGQGYSSKLAS